MLKKKGVIEFSWIFALIVGAVVLFLAFYFIGTKLVENKVGTGLIVENSFDILLNPFSSFGGLGATSSKEISLQKKEMINFSCDTDDNFGFSSILEITDPKIYLKPIKVYDKYLFSEKSINGKNFQIISKPFSMPWRVADLIYIIPRDQVYCFVNMPDIEEEFGEKNAGMNISNFKFVQNKGDCGNSVSVCSNGCDINVYYNENYVLKKSQRFYFIDDATMYAAIFSDYNIYNCNIKRLAKRTQFQTEIYRNKVVALNSRGCSVVFNLQQIDSAAGQVANEGANKLTDWGMAADNLISQNKEASCTLF